MEQQTHRNHTRSAAGDTDRHWQLGSEGARRVLSRTSQTGTTQPLSRLSAEMADRALERARRRPAPPVEDLPTIMVDPSLGAHEAEAPPQPPPRPRRPRGWMFVPESGGRPSIVDADDLRAATARPFGGLVLWVRRLFTS